LKLDLGWTLVLGWLIIAGLAGFILMGIDKKRAQKRERRVPERTFYELALMGGTFGVLVGAFAFHHKTSKATFFGIVVFLTIGWLVLLKGMQMFLGAPFG
jgi:uncharacterized membrane protein YsdA (DUF1294 family)